MLALVVVSGGTLAAAQAPAAAAPDAASPAKAAAPEPAAPEPAAAVPKPSAAEEKPADDAAAKPPLPDKPRILPPFRQLPVVTEEQEKAFRAQRSNIQRSLRNGTIPPDQEQAFRQYYYGYALARWTYVDRQHEVAGYRRELRNELSMSYKAGRANQAHDHLAMLVLNFMKNVVRMDLNFSPAARSNAILMIGDLNQEEAGTGAQAPLPLAEAMPFLVSVFQDPAQTDEVKIGALNGICRHVVALKSRNNLQAISLEAISTLVALAKMRDPERVRSDEGHAWMRTLAVEALAEWGGASNPAALADVFRNIVAETESPLFLRYAAAEALGKVAYQGNVSLDMNAYLHTLGMLAVSVCDIERERLHDEQLSASQSGAPGGMGYGAGMPPGAEGGMASSAYGMDAEFGMGMGYGMAAPASTEETRRIDRLRRRFKEGLSAVLIGLGKKSKTPSRNEAPYGLEAIAGQQAQKDLIARLSTPIHDCFAVIDEKKDNRPISTIDLAKAIE
ncbi:MAG: hypothetical protein PHO07_08730, partial [Pirellulales bacterium]|nr:hypothetical protein [Pirellulales bacterium]